MGKLISKIGIIDADLIGRKKHRFPNLVCMKLAGYWREKGAEVTLLTDYDHIKEYDKVFVCKVFTDTPIPKHMQTRFYAFKAGRQKKVEFGGTGFFFDKAPPLPDEIEHHMPYYDLYLPWIKNETEKARKTAELSKKTFDEKKFLKQFKEYTDYSIGFTTRGCFRKCAFCVNQKYDRVFMHSPLKEFVDPKRKKICLLDDNVLGCPQWRDILNSLRATGKPFKFKQGLDERLLTDEKCELLFSSKYDSDFTFAFDNIEDYDLIHEKLKMIRRHTKKLMMFYVLVGFKGTDEKDIENAFRRIELLFNYKCIPYLMRYMNKNDVPYKRSKWRSLYISMARWTNQPSLCKKMTFREFCDANQAYYHGKGTCIAKRAMDEFEKEFPDIATRYFDIRFGDRTLED